MKLVDDVKDWSKWWSVRLSILGGTLLTITEGFPNAIANIYNALPAGIIEAVPDDVIKVIGIVCVSASPIARVLKQSRLDDEGR